MEIHERNLAPNKAPSRKVPKRIFSIVVEFILDFLHHACNYV
jgi:hypothetical protein